MVQDIYVVGLQRKGLLLVLLRVIELVDFVEAKGPVLEGLKVLGVQLKGRSVVSDGQLLAALLAVGESAVVVEVRLLGVDVNRHSEILNGLVEVVFAVERDALVVLGKGTEGC